MEFSVKRKKRNFLARELYFYNLYKFIRLDGLQIIERERRASMIFFLLKFENSSPRYTVRVFETSRFLKSCIKLIQLSKFICFNPKILSNLKFNPQVFKLRKPLYNSAFKELNLEASKAWFDVKNFKKKKNKNRAFFI